VSALYQLGNKDEIFERSIRPVSGHPFRRAAALLWLSDREGI
jgi:hypothetical protein